MILLPPHRFSPLLALAQNTKRLQSTALNLNIKLSSTQSNDGQSAEIGAMKFKPINDVSKVTNPQKMSFEIHDDSEKCKNAQADHRSRRCHHQKNVFIHHPHKVQIIGSMSHSTASTASISDSEFGCDSIDLHRVHRARVGGSLESISSTGTSLVEDEYWRLNYESMNDDNSSSIPPTKNSATTYYRPVDSFEERISYTSPTSSQLPHAVSARTTCNHSDDMSAVTFNYSFSDDGLLTSGRIRAKSPQRNVEKKNCWTDDDSELKRMESITHSFQRTSSMTSRNRKISAPPLSGIGVEICRSASYQQDHIPTPREAANASCSLSSIMGELLGVEQPTENENRSRSSLFSTFVSKLLKTEQYLFFAFSSMFACHPTSENNAL